MLDEGPAAAAGGQPVRTLPLFSGLRPEDAEVLVRSCQDVRLGPGGCLFAQGEVADDLYIVVEGRLDIVLAGEAGEVVVGAVGPGDLVGEMGVVDAAPRSATVRAATAARLLCLDGAAFRALIDAAHPAAWTLLREMRRVLVRRILRQRPAPAAAVAVVEAEPAGPASGPVQGGPGAPDAAEGEAGLVGRLRGLLGAFVGGPP